MKVEPIVDDPEDIRMTVDSSSRMRNIPPELDRIADIVLAYKPKEKVKATKRRAKRKRQRDTKKG